MKKIIKKILVLCLCALGFISLRAQSLSDNDSTIQSLHEIISYKKNEILSLACEKNIPASFWGPLHDTKYSYCKSIDLSVFMEEIEFTVIVSQSGNRGQVTVSVNGDNEIPFVFYIFYNQFDGVGCPMQLDMGAIQLTKDPLQYDKESDNCNRRTLRMEVLQEISDKEMYIHNLQNIIIPVLDEIIQGSNVQEKP